MYPRRAASPEHIRTGIIVSIEVHGVTHGHTVSMVCSGTMHPYAVGIPAGPVTNVVVSGKAHVLIIWCIVIVVVMITRIGKIVESRYRYSDSASAGVNHST